MNVCALPVPENPSFLPVSGSRGHKIINKRHSERKKWKSTMRGRGEKKRKELLEEQNGRRRRLWTISRGR
jgi:hypothetical protein